MLGPDGPQGLSLRRRARRSRVPDALVNMGRRQDSSEDTAVTRLACLQSSLSMLCQDSLHGVERRAGAGVGMQQRSAAVAAAHPGSARQGPSSPAAGAARCKQRQAGAGGRLNPIPLNSMPVNPMHRCARQGIKKAELKDELYMQLLKQSRGNGTPSSARAWELLFLVASAMPPSKDFVGLVSEYVHTIAHGDAEVDAASRALAQRTWSALKRSAKAGTRRTVRRPCRSSRRRLQGDGGLGADWVCRIGQPVKVPGGGEYGASMQGQPGLAAQQALQRRALPSRNSQAPHHGACRMCIMLALNRNARDSPVVLIAICMLVHDRCGSAAGAERGGDRGAAGRAQADHDRVLPGRDVRGAGV